MTFVLLNIFLPYDKDRRHFYFFKFCLVTTLWKKILNVPDVLNSVSLIYPISTFFVFLSPPFFLLTDNKHKSRISGLGKQVRNKGKKNSREIYNC